jgi:hypothetical protein
MITRSNGLVLALLAPVLLVSAAQATPPVFVPAPIPDHTDTRSCAFPVELHYTANGETARFFSDGTIIISGPLAATYSANGKSLSLNIAGPSKIMPSGAIFGYGVGTGPTVLPDGELTLGYLAGNVTVDISAGTVVLLHGHLVLDICAALEP